MGLDQNSTFGQFHAGIDEAGYGPQLGPLCSASVHIRCAPGASVDGAEAMELAQSVLTDAYGLLIADSKTLYHSPDDLWKLWGPVAAIAGAFRDPPAPPVDTETLLKILCAPDDLVENASQPWHDAGEDFSVAKTEEAMKFNGVAERIRRALDAAGAKAGGVRVRVLSSTAFNRQADALGNKAEINWALTADHMKFSEARADGGEAIVFYCDRHGGRRYYAEKITETFGEFVWAEEETEEISRYRLMKNGRDIRVEFRVEGESYNALTALAGMAAKLVREIWMRRFNRFFRLIALPEKLKPTSGYHNDSGRFLKQAEGIIKLKKFKMDDLVRKL